MQCNGSFQSCNNRMILCSFSSINKLLSDSSKLQIAINDYHVNINIDRLSTSSLESSSCFQTHPSTDFIQSNVIQEADDESSWIDINDDNTNFMINTDLQYDFQMIDYEEDQLSKSVVE
jgi:hypothetical protein